MRHIFELINLLFAKKTDIGSKPEFRL